MNAGRAQDILIGPRTTVYALLQAYPALEPFLRTGLPGFEALRDKRAHIRWARMMTLAEVSRLHNLPCRQLVREIAAEVTRLTGRLPRTADAPRRIVDDERRVGELRDIVGSLEDGAPLLEAAARWRSTTADLEGAEADALDAALSDELVAGHAAVDHAVTVEAEMERALLAAPPGHPLEVLRREAGHIRRLAAGLKAGLDRLGGSPARRRWQQGKPLVWRLVRRLSAIELRFRRERQAWFPTLERHGVQGPQGLLRTRQDEALEMLRRLRLAVEGDDAASVAETGRRLTEALEDLLVQDERLLEPLAVRSFSQEDWEAVRELEDGVGWGLIERPPAWPDPSVVKPRGDGSPRGDFSRRGDDERGHAS